MSAPRALSLWRLAFALALAAFPAAIAAAQESGDSVAAPPRPRAPFAPFGARTITIFPDSLPDVPRTMTELLAMGAPGVFVQHSSGAAGAGAWISIRDAAAVTAEEPLIVVDGIPTVSFAVHVAGADERRAPSRIDEIPVASVERIDILAGPAAAARYGRDARAGVIEITTRAPGRGRPAVRASLGAGGTASADEFPRNGTRIGSSGNICTVRETAGSCASPVASSYTPLLDASPFSSAPVREGHVDVTGGLPAASYAVDLSHERAGGVIPADGRDLTSAGVRLAIPVPVSGQLRLTSRATFRGTTIPFEGEESIVTRGLQGAVDCSSTTPCLPGDSSSRGYGLGTPEMLAHRGTRHRAQHFTHGAILTLEPRSWLELRSTATSDGFLDQGGWAYDVDTWAFGAMQIRDERNEHSVRNVLAQDVVARRGVLGWDLAASLGFRAEHERSNGSSYDFEGAGGTASWSTIEFRGSQRRQVVTLAPRLTGPRASLGFALVNSRTRVENVGMKMPATLDGSADVSITLVQPAEERWLRGVVLRAATGQASAYSPGNVIPLWSTVGFVMAPNSKGELQPDRTWEGEAGIDATFAPASLRLAVTGFRRRETDRGMFTTIGMSGYPLLLPTLRRVINGGELQASLVPIARDAARLETNIAFAIQSDRVRSPTPNFPWFGGLYYGRSRLEFERGMSFGSWVSAGYTYADSNSDGVLGYNEIKATEPRYTGRSRPSRFGSLDARLTLARRWTLGANLGYLGGHKVLDKAEVIRCAVRLCSGWQSTDLGEQARAAMAESTPYFVSGDALRVRELSLAWAVPQVARIARADDMRVTLAIRNVATFSHARYADPETELPAPGFAGDVVQSASFGTPRSVVARLSMAF